MIVQPVALVVNGERIQRSCEPRTHLGDFLRKDLGLTGTHLSCEHGVCGACTVLIDGQPQRSCITFAVACENAEITTIEGYSSDPVMAALREAFHTHHALQCGYCTPGMLCTARDIVLRLPGPDPQRVRNELAGNICRCTGYVGIVEAIGSVLDAKARGELTLPAPAIAPAAPVTTREAWVPIEMPTDGDWIEVSQQIALAVAAADVWTRLQDLSLVARCLPGASVTAHTGERAEGVIAIRFGPITASFDMRAERFLDDATRTARLNALGTDRLSGTRVKTRVTYAVEPQGGNQSTLAFQLAFQLAGPLAQFARAGLVTDYVTELSRLFGENLQKAAGGETPADSAATPAAGPSLWRLLMARIRRWFGG